MADRTTYIKIDRNITRWRWYSDANTFRVFFHLLINANHKDGNYKGIEIKRGQGVFTYKNLAKELSLTEQNVKTAISHLKSTQELTISKGAKNTLYTVTNYNLYQGNQLDNQLSTNFLLTFNQPHLKERERKKERSKENKEIERNIQEGVEIKEGGMGEGKEAEQVKALFNATCTTMPKIILLTKNRRLLVSKLLQTFSLEEIEQGFRMASQSPLLTGKNKFKWKATFDWLIDIEHFTRLLEGNYNDDNDDNSFESDEFFQAALNRSYGG